MKKIAFILFLFCCVPFWVNALCTGTVHTVNNPSLKGTSQAHVTPSSDAFHLFFDVGE